MLAIAFMIGISVALFALVMLDMRAAFFATVFLYGVYPKFLALGLGEQGFALSGIRVFLVILFLGYLIKLLMKSPQVAEGLSRIRKGKAIAISIAIMLIAKIAGNATYGQFALGSLGAFADEFLTVAFAYVLACTYLRSTRDFVVLFICLSGSVIVNEIAVVAEYVRGGSIFHGLIDLQYQTATDRDLLAGRVRDGSYRFMGLLPNPLVLASLICISLPAMLSLVFRQRDFTARTIGAIALAGAAPVLLLTFARAGIAVGVLIACIALYFHAVRNLDSFLRPIATVCTLAVGGTALLVVGHEIFSAVISAGGQQGIRSAQSRLLQFATVLPALKDHLVFGVGFARNYDILLDVGNVDGHFLRTTIQGGLIGLFAFVGALTLGFKYSLEAKRFSGSDSGGSNLAADAVIATLLVLSLLMLVYSQHNTAMYIFVFLGAATSFKSGTEQEFVTRGRVAVKHEPFPVSNIDRSRQP